MYAQLSEPPPSVTSRRADLLADIDQVLARALAKAPASRYPSCQEFADALLQALGSAPHRFRVPASEEPAPDHPPTRAGSVSDRPGWRLIPAAGAAAGTARSRTPKSACRPQMPISRRCRLRRIRLRRLPSRRP
jgi:hypothetical protein